MAEIGDMFEEVDECLEVLLAAGMSNSLLQDVHQHGISVSDIGTIKLSTTYLAVAAWAWVLWYLYCAMPTSGPFMLTSGPNQWALYVGSCSVQISWLLVYLFLEGHVRRMFALKCMIKLVLVCGLLSFPVVMFIHAQLGYGVIGYGLDPGYDLMFLVDTFGVITVLMSVLNIDFLLSIPCAGPWFAALMFGCACHCADQGFDAVAEEEAESSSCEGQLLRTSHSPRALSRP